MCENNNSNKKDSCDKSNVTNYQEVQKKVNDANKREQPDLKKVVKPEILDI